MLVAPRGPSDEALLDGRGDAGGHLRGGVPVVGAHGAASLLADAAGRLMPPREYVERGGLGVKRGRGFYNESG